jgi:hypothetical protein
MSTVLWRNNQSSERSVYGNSGEIFYISHFIFTFLRIYWSWPHMRVVNVRRVVVDVLQRMGERYNLCRLRHQKPTWSRWQTELLRGIFFDSEDGDTYLRNVGWLSAGYTAFYSVILSGQSYPYAQVPLHGYIYAFLTSAVVGGEWSSSRSDYVITTEDTPSTHWIGSWVGPRVPILLNVQFSGLSSFYCG